MSTTLSLISPPIYSDEYNFDDLSPPVHAYACWRVYQITKRVSGVADLPFLERCFHKLLLNFSFWSNKKVRLR